MFRGIRADQRDYQSSFHKHYHSYLNGNDDHKISEISRLLLLVYCVESGLKCILMRNARIFSLEKASDELSSLLASHNFELLLIRLPKSGYRFPPFKTKHGDQINANTFHQLCRYSIPSDDKDMIQQYQRQLEKIAEWLNEKV